MASYWHRGSPIPTLFCLVNQVFEVFCTVTDDLGTRTIPTGTAAFLEAVAYDKLELLKSTCAIEGATFFVEYVPSADEWNSY